MTQDHAEAVQAVTEFADGEKLSAIVCGDFGGARQRALKFAGQLAYVAAMADAALKLEQALRHIMDYGYDPVVSDCAECGAAKNALAAVDQVRKGEKA